MPRSLALPRFHYHPDLNHSTHLSSFLILQPALALLRLLPNALLVVLLAALLVLIPILGVAHVPILIHALVLAVPVQALILTTIILRDPTLVTLAPTLSALAPTLVAPAPLHYSLQDYPLVHSFLQFIRFTVFLLIANSLPVPIAPTTLIAPPVPGFLPGFLFLLYGQPKIVQFLLLLSFQLYPFSLLLPLPSFLPLGSSSCPSSPWGHWSTHLAMWTCLPWLIPCLQASF